MQKEKRIVRRNLKRDSGIELLKIIAIILIVISHVVRALRAESAGLYSHEYMLDFTSATGDIQQFILILFSHFGVLGNTIFFICSAWFLLRSSSYSKRKWFAMLFEIWFVSVFILAVTLIMRRGDITGRIMLSSLMPTTFSNNWYMTCYLLFYPIHPLLNIIICKMDKRQHFRIMSAMCILYCGFSFVIHNAFFFSELILWITMYFLIAYLQRHTGDFMNSKGKNLVLLAVGLIGYIGMAAVTNLLGLKFSFLSDKVLHWAIDGNPFLIAVSVALFNLMRRWTFQNKAINYVSGLSLLVYIIHENLVLRTYYRPLMWKYIYHNFGYDRILLWVFAMALVIFLFALVCSVLYDVSVRRFVKSFSERLYALLRKVILRIETAFLTLH